MKIATSLRSLLTVLLVSLASLLPSSTQAALVQIQQVTPADFTTSTAINQPEAQAGRSVAVSGNWMVVGAPGASDRLRNLVTVYERVGMQWLRRATLTDPTTGQTGTGYGSAVDIDEQLGIVTVIVGSPTFDTSFPDAGMARIYTDTDPAQGINLSNSIAVVSQSQEADGRFGASVGIWGDTAAITEPGDGAVDNGAVSIRSRQSGWAQLTSRIGTVGSGFGFALDLHGEYLIVGAPQATNGDVVSGGAQVFRQDQGGANGWGQVWTLTPTAPQDGMAFGAAVGIWDADVSTAFSSARSVVGAPQTAVSSIPAVGGVHFFSDNTAGAALSPTGNVANRGGQAGFSVAIDNASALAGAPGFTVAGARAAGRVHSYGFNGSSWVAATDVVQSVSGAGHQYGWAVDVSDAVGVAGAPGTRHDAVNLPPGAVRVGSTDALLRTGLSWAVESRVDLLNMLPATSQNQLFGGGTAIGSQWLAIGVPLDPQHGNNAGAVYMYRRTGDNWTPHSKLTALYSGADQRFGEVLALDGDRLVVGMPPAGSFPGNFSNGGQVVVFRYDGNVWAQVAQFSSPSAAADGEFGRAVDLSGDVLAIGAPGELSARGRVYVYRDLVAFNTPQFIEIAGTVAGDRTGAAVAVDDLGVGAPNNEVLAIGAPTLANGIGVGFALYGTNFTTRVPLIDPQSVGNGRLAASIDVQQNRIIVSRAPVAGDSPKAYIFSGSFYSVVQTLNPPPGINTSVMPVAIDGNLAMIGVRDAINGNRGRVLTWRFNGSTWVEEDNLQPANTVSGDLFGSALALKGGLAVVGAPQHDPAGLFNAGTAFTYIPAPEVLITPFTVNVAESGGPDGTVRFSLDRAPAANVTTTLTFDSSQIHVDAGGGFGASPRTVTLTPANALAGVTIAVRAVDDSIDETDPHTVAITTSNTASSDTLFNNLPVLDPQVSIADNDIADVLVQPTGTGNAVAEGGATDLFRMNLRSEPVANVDVILNFPAGELSLNGDTDGTYVVRFNQANWPALQGITIVAVNDRALEGTTIENLVATVTSSDPLYNGKRLLVDGIELTDTLPVTITDNELAVVGWATTTATATEGNDNIPQVRLDIVANPAGGTPTLEGTLAYQVQLTLGSASAADLGAVTGALSFTDAASGTLSNIGVPHIDDALAEALETYTLTLSNLTGPAGATLGSVTLTGRIQDNDVPSVLVTQSGGTTTATEGGSGDGISVVLTSEPFAPVTVQLLPGTQLDAVPTALSFNAGNWNQPQAVAIAAREDAIAEGAHGGTVGFNVTGSDTAYSGFATAPVMVAITDNDVAGVTRVESGGNTAVDEGGTSDSYTLVLTSEPVANVVITPTGDAQVGASPATLTFTASNWNQPQAVTAQAVDDAVAEGSHGGTISHGVASSDPMYQGFALTPTAVAISDNDVVGLAILQSAGSTEVVEGGLGDSITVALTSQPTATVTVSLSGGTQVSAVPTPLTFTTANWNVPRTVAVNAVNDAIAEGPHSGNVVFTPSSADPSYQDLVVAPMAVAITDNDNAALIVAQSGGDTRVTEGGATDSYSLVLGSQPLVDVVVTVNGDAQASGVPTPLTFTAANWNLAQTVTVMATDDFVAEGPHSGTLSHSVASADPMYTGLAVASVPVAITDNDNAGVTMVQSGGDTRATEGGATDTYTLVLTSQPVADVVIAVNGDAQASASPSPLTFTAANWNVARTITVSALDDARVEGNHGASIVHAVSSSDPNYQGHVIPPVAVSITDNDSAGVRITPSNGGNAATEGGNGDSFEVTLTSEPVAAVNLTLAAGAQLNATPTTLSFTGGNWNVAQTVSLGAIDDLVAEGTHTGSIGVVPTSSDGDYQGLVVPPVAVTITDNDSAGTALVQSGGSTDVAEGGSNDTITIALTSEPAAPVQISVQPNAQLGVLPATLSYTKANWQLPQTVTISAIDDAAVENAHTGTVNFASSSTDPFYQGLTLAPLTVQIIDNDGIPEITAVPALSRQQGSPGAVSAIANVADEQQAAGTLAVSVVPGGSALGVTATEVVNADGVVSARLAATCTATGGTLRLRVVDSGGLSATTDLQVNVVDNTPPLLVYGLNSVVVGGLLSVNPTSGPSDNGSVSLVAVQSVGGYGGSASVTTAGVVQLSDAGPVGSQTLVIRSTDQCGATTDATLSVEVTRALSFKLLTADVAPSRFGQPVTFSAELVGVNPTGNVQFFAGTTALGSASLQSSPSGGNNLKLATLTTSQLPVGLSQVRVEYTGDANNLPATSGNLPHTVIATGTRIAVTPAANPAPVGAVVLQVQVAAEAPGGGVPAGSVLLAAGTGNQCTAMLAGGQGSCSLNFASVGYKAIVAAYTPTAGTHLASTGGGAVVVVASPSSTDLRVRIGNGVSSVQPGQLLRYLIVAENRGSTAAVGRLQAPLGAAFSTGTWRCLTASGAACPTVGGMGIGDVDTELSLDAGAVVVYELLVVAPAPPEAPVSQSAQLSVRAPTTDPLAANNQATDTDPMGLFADGFEDSSVDE